MHWNRTSALENRKTKASGSSSFASLMNKILSRAALARAAASRGLEDVKVEMEQHFHLVVCTN